MEVSGFGSLRNSKASWIKGQGDGQIQDAEATLPPAETLHRFPRGPSVPFYLVTDDLVSAYAEFLDTRTHAIGLLIWPTKYAGKLTLMLSRQPQPNTVQFGPALRTAYKIFKFLQINELQAKRVSLVYHSFPFSTV